MKKREDKLSEAVARLKQQRRLGRIAEGSRRRDAATNCGLRIADCGFGADDVQSIRNPTIRNPQSLPAGGRRRGLRPARVYRRQARDAETLGPGPASRGPGAGGGGRPRAGAPRKTGRRDAPRLPTCPGRHVCPCKRRTYGAVPQRLESIRPPDAGRLERGDQRASDATGPDHRHGARPRTSAGSRGSFPRSR